MSLYKLLIYVVCFAIAGFSTLTLATPTAPMAPTEASRPSVAKTNTVEFMGKQFVLKFRDYDHPIKIAEYFLAQETITDWHELIEFQIYPVNPQGNKPVDFARRTAQAFKRRYPKMQLALLVEKKTGDILLDFFYPISMRKEKGKSFVEFNAFKYFKDATSDHVMSFHYAKNIEGANAVRSMTDVANEIRNTRAKIIPAMAKFPRYRQ